MAMRRLMYLVAAMGLMFTAATAQQTAPSYAPVETMPQDRVADSYAIYSLLLPGNAIEWGDAPRSQWLVEDTTTAVPLGSDCLHGGMMNPHESIRAPKEREADLRDLLADFDAQCHARFQLRSQQLRVKLPVRLLNEEERNRFAKHVGGYVPPANDIMRAPATPEEFKGAAGLHSFTAVYFNAAHTLAMTEIGMYCGGLCGNWKWVVLERTPQGWRSLPWVFAVTFS